MPENRLYTANTVSIKDLLESLGETVIKSGKEYRWQRHDSLVMNDNLWYQHSRQRGGLPVDLLVIFFNYSKENAIDYILKNLVRVTKHMHTSLKQNLQIPLPYHNENKVKTYLIKNRFIDKEIVESFITNKLIYEDRKHHNCVFIGNDENNTPQHIHVHSTTDFGLIYKGNHPGSNAKYSFHYYGNTPYLYIFEAPIDMLSFISLNKENWKDYSYLSLCGLSPLAIEHYLDNTPNTNGICLCLDNDFAGQEALSKIKELIETKYNIHVNYLIPRFKDFNEDLKFKYNQPVLQGLMGPFEQVVKDVEKRIIDESTKEKDKILKDLFNPFSVFLYGSISNNEKQKKKANEALIECAKVCLFLARQQYRHFGIKYTIADMIDLLNNTYKLSIKYIDKDESSKSLIKELNHVKSYTLNKTYLDEREKKELINHYMTLSKKCICTYVYLIINKE